MEITKIIVVTGGVISGLGKGIVSASIGMLLQKQGFKVEMIKIDPYLNVDAGTMRPTEHGEVYVTYDGGETDQDLGTYERFLGREFSRINNITNGQIFLSVISRERALEYGGKTVEFIPHITDEINRRVDDVIDKNNPDFLIVEVGGTVGDYQNYLFLDAFRVRKLKYNNVMFVHIVYMIVPSSLGEMKTKPAQHSVRMLNENGIQPDLVVVRSPVPVDDIRIEKLSIFGNIKKELIVQSPNVENVYEVPIILENQHLTEKIFLKFGIKKKIKPISTYKKKLLRIKSIKDSANVAIIGKYFDTGNFSLTDSYLSVIEALKHAGWSVGYRINITWIDSKRYEKNERYLEELSGYDGVIVPGGFGKTGVEGKIKAIRYVRENNIPYLGLCYGMQLAVIEFARNVCNMKGANTTEIDKKTKYPVIDILPEQYEKLKKKDYGNTMRLGNYKARLKKGTLVYSLYKKESVLERHRHRYEVNPKYVKMIEKKGAYFSGYHGNLMEFFEIKGHKFFLGTQAHPELKSKFEKPHPLFVGFVKALKN